MATAFNCKPMIDLAPNNPYGLALAQPVLAAAGCFGYGVEYARSVDLAQLGAIVTRTTTLHPRRTPRPPRIVETPAGLLSVGPWPNPGLEAVLNRYAPQWAALATPVILSVGGDAVGDFAQIAKAVEGVAGVAGLELALPSDISRAVAVVTAARRATFLPLLVKLPPLDAEPLLALAQALVAAGADALVACAAPHGMAIDTASGERLEGWLSGPALRPLGLRLVAELAPQLSVPVIGCGGVSSADDARAYLGAGALAVQIGAALLVNPYCAAEIGAALALTPPL